MKRIIVGERRTRTILYPVRLACPYIIVFFLLLQGCVSHQELKSFDQANFPYSSPEAILNQTELTIQPNDLLRITVHSIKPAAAAPFNIDYNPEQGGSQAMMMNQQSGQGNNLELFMGYMVDEGGFIDFPVLGPIAVEGKTIREAKTEIRDSLTAYLNDPVVNMRFLNLKISVLGEVRLPGVIRLTNPRVTILEAIGMAGDLTDYANRNNVLVMREEAGERTYARLDLHNESIISSPYFYLQQNDVIYVEPLKVRTATVADPAQRLISYGTAALTLVTLVIALVK